MEEIVFKQLFDPSTTRKRVRFSRIRWWDMDPGVASILASLKYVETTADPTGQLILCGVDGFNLYCNPKWIACLNDQQLDGLMLHEAAHVMLLHPFRCGDRHPMAWNVACDKAINSMIKDANYDLPTFPPPQLPDSKEQWLWSAEAHYRLMEEQGQIMKVNCNIRAKGEDGETIGEGSAHGDVMEPRDEGGQKLSEDQKRDISEKLGRDIQSMMGGKEAGSMSAACKRRIEDMLDYVVDWRQLLAEFVSEALTNEFDWSRPNKRMFALGLKFPSLRAPEEQALKGVLMIDTSGSISDEQLSAFQGEVNGICEAFHIEEMHVIYFSDRVHAIKVFKDGQPVKLKSKWSGGTDFQPPFAACTKLFETMPGFKFAVMFTDLECGSYPRTPWYPTFFANYNRGNPGAKAPFGITVPITR